MHLLQHYNSVDNICEMSLCKPFGGAYYMKYCRGLLAVQLVQGLLPRPSQPHEVHNLLIGRDSLDYFSNAIKPLSLLTNMVGACLNLRRLIDPTYMHT